MNFFRSIRRVLAATALLTAAAVPAQAANTAFNGAAVTGCSYASASQTYTCASLPLPNDTASISIASGYTVVASSAASFTYNQGLTMSGSAALQTSGDLNIGDINPANLSISGGSLTTGGNFKIGAQAQTITANITAATMSIGTGSTTKITGSLTSTGTIDLASHVTIVGPISGTTITTNSPVNLTGNITASTSLTLASGSSVTGNVSGGALTLQPASTSITGNVNMTGDVDIGSGDDIAGNLVAHNVTTESSNGYISGNASVNSLVLNYGGYVGGTVTCTAPGASGCSCVNYSNSGRAAPTCAAAAPSGLDHILITQSGSGLTCQPSTVTLTACADAACSTQYSNSVTAVLTSHSVAGNQTVNQSYSFTGSTSASVQQTTADTVNLSATASAGNPYVCKNTGSNNASCAMAFSDTGLQISSPNMASASVGNFVSATATSITVSALKKGSNSAASCQPLLNGAQTVNLGCTYINPASGTLPAIVNGTPLAANSTSACSSGGANVSLTFNSSGVATASLNYSDVGQLALAASYTGTGSYTGLKAGGASNTFTVAPASLRVTVPNNPAATTVGSGTVFMKAGQSFTSSVSALNSAGAVTLNYGKESSPESFLLSSSKLSLSGGVDSSGAPVGDNPFVAPTPLTWTMAPASPGSFTSNALVWNEVGSFELDAALSNSGGYLGSGLFAKGNTVVGRFIPDHFLTAIQTANNVPMSCSLTSPVYAIANCPPSKQAVYSNQPFAVTVTAKGPTDSQGNSTTLLNYYGQLASNISFSGWTSAGSTTASNQNPPSASSQMPDVIAKGQFANGVAPAPTAAPQTIRYVFVTATGSNPPAPLAVYLRAIDGDLTTTTGASSTEPSLLVASGRLLASNNYGSETSPMPVILKAQYWNGTAYLNSISDNNSTGYALSTVASASSAAVAFTNCTQHLATGGTAGVGQPNCSAALKLKTSPSSLIFSNGATQFVLAPPGSGDTGTVDIAIGALLSPYVTSFLPAVSGRATFGVYRSGPVIYLREVY